MNASVTVENSAYERIAINLAELLDEVGGENEGSLYQLLSSAYQAAYQKAAEETVKNPIKKRPNNRSRKRR